MPTRLLGVIQNGVAAGIRVVAYEPRHHYIDPDEYSSKELRWRTSPRWGSKWLKGLTDEDQLALVTHVLEENGVRLHDRAGPYRGRPQPRPVGLTDGELVHTVEVQFDGGTAHGYPCPP